MRFFLYLFYGAKHFLLMNVANNIYSCYKYVRSHIEKKHILHFLNRPTEKDDSKTHIPNSALSRAFEEILLRQITHSYSESLNFYAGNQFRFLKNSAALPLVDFVKSNFKRKCLAVMSVDLQKAFGTVNPKLSALKLQHLGLSDSVARLMLSYLMNRQTATTIIGDIVSDFRKTNV